VLEHARRVLAEIADARRRIGDTPGHVAGSLAVGAIPTIAPFLLPRVLRRFAKRWPDVKLSVVEDVTDHLLAALERGAIDVAVLSSAHVPVTIHSAKIATEPLRLMLPARHPLAQNRNGGSRQAGPVPWRAVAGERMRVLQEMHCLAGQVDRFCERAGVQPPVFMRGAQLSTVAAMVAAGLGVSVVPEMMCRSAKWPGCVTRPFADESPEREICVAWSLLRYRSNAARAFEELLQRLVG
jgi:LysR family hydrogen peroxide-inducible transcriptional activator